MNEVPIAATAPLRRKRRRNATPEEKADWAKRFAESGLRQREFCRQHGLVLTTLQRWLGQVQGVRQTRSKGKAAFMEVKVTPSPSVSRWAAELCRTDGAILRLAHDVPPELLGQLLRSC